MNALMEEQTMEGRQLTIAQAYQWYEATKTAFLPVLTRQIFVRNFTSLIIAYSMQSESYTIERCAHACDHSNGRVFFGRHHQVKNLVMIVRILVVTAGKRYARHRRYGLIDFQCVHDFFFW